VLNFVRRSRFRGLFLRRFGCFGGVADHLVDHFRGGDALVDQVDGEPFVEEGHFLQPTGHGLEVVLGGLEDVRIGPEPHRGAGLLGLLTLLEGARHRVVVVLRPLITVAGDLHLEPAGQRVDHRHTHPVQTTRHRVRAVVAAELAAGVQLGHDDVDGGDAGGVHRHRDAAAVVVDLHTAVREDFDIDFGGVTRHRLVDGVVDDLPDQVVQATLTGRPDIHARSFANRFQPFKNLDVSGVVGIAGLLLGSHGRKALLGVARR
jgi:hypothetical protein